MSSSPPIMGSVSQPNGGSAFWVFFSFRCISADWAGQEVIWFATGALNCSVALKCWSVRENPADEKSCQLSVARFAARACG